MTFYFHKNPHPSFSLFLGAWEEGISTILWNLRQDYIEFKDTMSYIVRPNFGNQKRKKQNNFFFGKLQGQEWTYPTLVLPIFVTRSTVGRRRKQRIHWVGTGNLTGESFYLSRLQEALVRCILLHEPESVVYTSHLSTREGVVKSSSHPHLHGEFLGKFHIMSSHLSKHEHTKSWFMLGHWGCLGGKLKV